MGLGKSAENEIALLRAAMPAPEQQPPAADVQMMIPRVIRHTLQIVHDAVFRKADLPSLRSVGGHRRGQIQVAACDTSSVFFTRKSLAQMLLIRPLEFVS
jgi:hypothetical protein